MKMSLRSLIIAGLVSLTAVCMQAAEVLSEAVVLKLSGPVEVILPGKTESVSVKVGDKLPQGTTIITSNTGEIDVQVFPGTTSTIKAGTKVELEKLSLTSSNGVVTKQSAMVNIKVGSVLSNLDPTKKSINDYSVRTPKGVAAARGTIFEVTVSPTGQVRTYVTRGLVTFKSPDGTTRDIPPGSAVTVDAQGNITQVSDATDAQKDAAKEVEKKNGSENDHAIDITVVSPSAPL